MVQDSRGLRRLSPAYVPSIVQLDIDKLTGLQGAVLV